MTNTTAKQGLLPLLLPACLIGALYAWLGQDRKQQSVEQLTQALKAARAQEVPALVLAEQNAKLAALQREMSALEQEKKRLTEEWKNLSSFCATAATRPERAERLNALLRRHRLLLIDSGLADPTRDVKLAPALQQLAKVMTDKTGTPRLQVWRYNLQGKYNDMLRALRELDGDDAMAIPIGVTMKEIDVNETRREWTLLVWI